MTALYVYLLVGAVWTMVASRPIAMIADSMSRAIWLALLSVLFWPLPVTTLILMLLGRTER